MHRLALLAALVGGCTTTDSSDILTSGIYASIDATSAGDGTTVVTATLFVGNPIGLNYVDLTGDDSLVAIHATESKTMLESQVLGTVTHRASFAVDGEGEQFEVVFDRAIDAGAPSSIATLPTAFALANAPATASRAAALAVDWSPSGTADRMSWEVEGDCIEREASSLTGDAGTLTIPAGAIKRRMGNGIADQCDITLTVRRARAGVLDPGYGKGGTIDGNQVRSVTLTSTP